jgi:hypothetical protein
MKCPACGSDEAYVGFNDIDCPNKICRHFQGGAAALSGATTAAPMPPTPLGGRPTIPSYPAFPNPGGWGAPPTMAPPSLSVRISRVQPLQNNVKISFIASGDPGHPDKEVDIHFDIGNGDQLCTLSNPNVTYVAGVDADGTTVYTTNWLCVQDGVKPTDTYQLKAYIN